MPDYYTIKDISEKLNLMPPAIRAHIRAGNLKATKINGAYLIKQEDLDEFLKRRGSKQWTTK